MKMRPSNNDHYSLWLLSVAVLLFLLAVPAITTAGEWQVIPIRLDFDKGTKSGVLTVKNRADESLNIQIKAFAWSQDNDGKDQYIESADLIYLPKIATVDKDGEQVIRTGLKFPATSKEKTYRLFVEEIPKPRKAESSTIAIAIRFGVPIFVKPIKEENAGEVASLTLDKGKLDARITNSGNVHFNITALTVSLRDAKGGEVYTTDVKGWYLLSGASRLYSIPIPGEACAAAQRADLTVKTDKVTLQRTLEVTKAMCQP